MSIAFEGGFEKYNISEPKNDGDVLNILQRFIRDRFKDASVADEITEDWKHFILWDSGRDMAPKDFGEVVAYGSFMYGAKDHSVQTIWENQFEIRSDGDMVFVYVSSWYGTTVESWEKKVERETLYL